MEIEKDIYVDILGELVPIVGVHEGEDRIILLPDNDKVTEIILNIEGDRN